MKTSVLLLISLMTLSARGTQDNRDEPGTAPAVKPAASSKAPKTASAAKTAKAAKGTPAAKPAAAATAAPAAVAEKDPGKLEIPAGAVRSEDGFYRYTDAAGKKWLYRQTPFGVSRNEDRPMEPKAAESPGNLKAIDDGDSIRFERPGPFGTYKWQRKKTELNEVEQAAWEREKTGTAAKQD